MSVNLNPVVSDIFIEPSFFQRSQTKNNTVYRFNIKELPKDNCYMFWNVEKHHAAALIARALEFFTFHPQTKINDKFDVNPIFLGNELLYMCSFPKEYKDVCKRVADTFKMQIVNGSKKFTSVRETNCVLDVPALTLEKDYKERWISGFKPEIQKPVPKDALAIPVQKKKETIKILFPKADNVLWFKGDGSYLKNLAFLEEQITSIGDKLQELGVD